MFRKTARNLFTLLSLLMVLTLAIPSESFGQGRGRGRGHRGIGIFNNDWKCDKFVNCHDARDGRIDGRGPNRDRFGNIFGVRRRTRRHYDDDFVRSRRLRRERNFDGDLVLRGRRHGRR